MAADFDQITNVVRCMKKIRLISAKGFTLIEVIVTVAIVGILTAIALPSYTQFILRGHRAEARNTLTAAAQRLEQNFTLNSSYSVASTSSGTTTIADATLATWGLAQVPLSGGARYNITFQGGAPSATTYTLVATPIGVQASDTCGALSLDNRSIKRVNGESNNRTGKTLECWSK